MAQTVYLKQNQRRNHPYKNWIILKNGVCVLILANNGSIITDVSIFCSIHLMKSHPWCHNMENEEWRS